GGVPARRIDTGRKYETQTNEAGLYLFPPVDPGEYRVTIEAAGMKTWEQTVQLATGQHAVLDATLAVGGAANEVTVTGEGGSPVETVDSTLATVVEHQRIEQLPLNGRSVATLVVQTSPGVDEGSGSTNRSSATLPRVFGL